ncbi:hypothetical protein AAL_05352 [Moelleriella libera RCEF 2490]|uniref:Uncharacterized protein n=1 Tax=Moelleriella libera RCEF 2490 TaxID=1081109 RepID=A0A168AUS7_9HYPO|nr:hypothetical protein AAL_05352 [Moelleriella libera RCEF 2490]
MDITTPRGIVFCKNKNSLDEDTSALIEKDGDPSAKSSRSNLSLSSFQIGEESQVPVQSQHNASMEMSSQRSGCDDPLMSSRLSMVAERRRLFEVNLGPNGQWAGSGCDEAVVPASTSEQQSKEVSLQLTSSCSALRPETVLDLLEPPKHHGDHQIQSKSQEADQFSMGTSKPRISSTIEHFEALIARGCQAERHDGASEAIRGLTESSSIPLMRKCKSSVAGAARRRLPSSWGPVRLRKIAAGGPRYKHIQLDESSDENPTRRRSELSGPIDGADYRPRQSLTYDPIIVGNLDKGVGQRTTFKMSTRHEATEHLRMRAFIDGRRLHVAAFSWWQKQIAL